LGVIAGVIFPRLIYVFLMQPSTTNAAAVPPTIAEPILALLGG
jgi:hypothetical protein